MSSAPPKPKRQRQFSTQIRIRLLPNESQAFEQLRLKEWQEGQSYPETLSSWVRHQLEPLIHPIAAKEECLIPKELYDVVTRHAQALGIEPETFIEMCILEIIHMASQNRPPLPAIAKACRNKESCHRVI